MGAARRHRGHSAVGEYIEVSGPSGRKSTFSRGAGAPRVDDSRALQWLKRRRCRLPSAPGPGMFIFGLIFQSFNLIGDITVYENVEYPLTSWG